MHKNHTTTLLALIFAASTSACFSQISLIGNLPQPLPPHVNGGLMWSAPAYLTTGEGFSLPTGTNYKVSSVTLDLYGNSLPNLPVVQLVSDNLGKPDKIVGTFTDPAPGVSGTGRYDITSERFTFAPASPIVLSAGSSYWLMVTTVQSPYFLEWIQNSRTPETPTGIGSFIGTQYSVDLPTWFDASDFFIGDFEVDGTATAAAPTAPGAALAIQGIGPYISQSVAPGRFPATGTPVPEAETYGLIGSASLLCGLLLKRRKS